MATFLPGCQKLRQEVCGDLQTQEGHLSGEGRQSVELPVGKRCRVTIALLLWEYSTCVPAVGQVDQEAREGGGPVETDTGVVDNSSY